MALFFKDLIRQRSALVFIDDILLTSNCKPHALQLIEQLHDIANEGNQKLAPEITFFMLFTVKSLGLEIGWKTQFNQFNPHMLQIKKFLFRPEKLN